jgi:drug/metabolite transporter (DMT)-like permease
MMLAESTVSSVRKGMFLMIAAMMIVPWMDAISKLLATSLSPGQIAWSRFALQSVFLLPVMLLSGRCLATRHHRLHMARGVLIGLSIILMVWSFQYLPLANAIAIFFIEPLILTLLAGLILREVISRERLLVVMVGLLGALIVIRPNWQAFGPATLLPVATAFCFAGYLLLTRYSSVSEDAVRMQLWAGLYASLALGIGLVIGDWAGLGPLSVAWPDVVEWRWLLLLGAVSAVGHVVLALAFRHAGASTLAPFQYLEIIMATALGWVLFAEFPDALTWFGTAIIIGAGLFVFWMERDDATAR